MRIFVTVGAQMPFDRLIRTVDEWIETRSTFEVFAQIGNASYVPRHIRFQEFIAPSEFRERVLWADLIVAHAGMGSILTAMQYKKRIVLMPRLGQLRETRNDHQLATAMWLKMIAKIDVAMDESELKAKLDNVRAIGECTAITDDASEQLLTAVRQFIDAE